MMADARSEANEPKSSGIVTDNELVKAGNRAQEMIATRIMESDENYFDKYDGSTSFVAGQEEYDLPALIRSRKITKIVRTDLDSSHPRDVIPIRFQEKDKYERTSLYYGADQVDGAYYYLRGDKIGFKPTPTRNISSNIRIYYLQLPHALHQGTVSSVASTTFTMGTMVAGRYPTDPNYFVNARIRVIAGNAKGTERVITAWNVATLATTIDSSWNTTDVATNQYVVVSPIPDEFQPGIYLGMLLKIATKKKDKSLYQMAADQWRDLLERIDRQIQPRNLDENRYVRPPVDFDW